MFQDIINKYSIGEYSSTSLKDINCGNVLGLFSLLVDSIFKISEKKTLPHQAFYFYTYDVNPTKTVDSVTFV